MPESEFLKTVGWGGGPFAAYRRQVLFDGEGVTVALNIPRSIANQVSRLGPESLSAEQRRLLPPVWERGQAKYFERFRNAMKDHAPEDAIERYFWAQSLWDDTMAWQALRSQAARPGDVLVIIVGEFHVEFGGGLPYELRRLGGSSVKTWIQVEVADLKPETLAAAIANDPVYGEKADFIWVRSANP
jgi:uncharacterized iron-regulated protein